MHNCVVRRLLILALLWWVVPTVSLAATARNDRWFSNTNSDTVIVFVHGILSDSTTCWTAATGEYWPDIVSKDARFENASIYLGGYNTSFDSGAFRIYDAAIQLQSYLTTADADGSAAPINKKNILFVAHSMGGLVVRQMLINSPQLFHDKAVGVILIASPSRGSAWANRLSWLTSYYGNKMAMDMHKDGSMLDTMDRSFAEIASKKDKIPRLAGMDVFESKFILPRSLWKFWGSGDEFVVSAEDSASYFGAYRIIPDTDHFSIVKPTSNSDPIETYLAQFYTQTFVPLTREATAYSDSAGYGVSPSTTGRKLFHTPIAINKGGDDAGDFNYVWNQGVTYRINSMLSSALSEAPPELQFDGADTVNTVKPADLEALSAAGRVLNGLAVATTVIQKNGGTTHDSYKSESIFRALYQPPDGGALSFPNILEQIPAGQNFGPISLQHALSKSWGYYVVLALAARCLADQSHLHCNNQKMVILLGDSLKSLGPADTGLSKEFSRLIALARAQGPQTP